MNPLFEEIKTLGQRYIPSKLPTGLKRGKVGQCFDTCLVLAHLTKFQYVEGIARDPRDRERWIYHAWLSDGEKAYDPTWTCFDQSGREQPVPTEYIGIPMNLQGATKFVFVTGYTGIIANRHLDPELAFQAIGKKFSTDR